LTTGAAGTLVGDTPNTGALAGDELGWEAAGRDVALTGDEAAG
jgi:hypothetical protein